MNLKTKFLMLLSTICFSFAYADVQVINGKIDGIAVQIQDSITIKDPSMVYAGEKGYLNADEVTAFVACDMLGLTYVSYDSTPGSCGLLGCKDHIYSRIKINQDRMITLENAYETIDNLHCKVK